MINIYVKTTIPELPEEVRVSIHSLLTAKKPEVELRCIRARAIKRGIPAQYELATEAEYKAHWAAKRAAVNA